MQKFETLTGVAAPLLIENINTDSVIPVRWIVNYGMDLGEGLFGGWRYKLDDSENPDFILNRPPYRDSRILLAGPNFGCGSSREEAPWALVGFGIRCVIAPSFGDIFFENSFKNGLLPIILDAATIEKIVDALAATPDSILTVDLQRCIIALPDGSNIPFTVEESRRQALLAGLDEIDQTLTRATDFNSFQSSDKKRRPWIYSPG